MTRRLVTRLAMPLLLSFCQFAWAMGSLPPARVSGPVLYTENAGGERERVFTQQDTVSINLVYTNTGGQSAQRQLTVEIVDDQDQVVATLAANRGINLPDGESRNLRFNWNTGDLASFRQSGYNFVGRRFEVRVDDGVSRRSTGFYVDEFGVPRWLRDVTWVELPWEELYEEPGSIESLRDRVQTMLTRTADMGFDAHNTYFYNKGERETNQTSTIQYFFPTGPDGDYHYTTPPRQITNRLGGDMDAGRDFVKWMVDYSRDLGMKSTAYIDPVGIYAPTAEGQALDPHAVAHEQAFNENWTMRQADGSVRRCSFFETMQNLPVLGPIQDAFGLSQCHELIAQTTPAGPSKFGPGDDDAGFHPDVVDVDLDSDWSTDPSFHYHIVRQVRWIMENYGFDVLAPDDTGRIIQGLGPAEYADWLHPNLIAPRLPEHSFFGLDHSAPMMEHVQRHGVDHNRAMLDSWSNLFKHLRWQVKAGHPERIVYSSDYLVPSDVGWNTIYGAADMTNSDQNHLGKPSFARWAWRNWQASYKPARNDMRLASVPGVTIPVPPTVWRPDMLAGMMIATSWANGINIQYPLPEGAFFTPESEWKNEWRYKVNYPRMRQRLRELGIPVYSEQVGRELLYHTRLNDAPEYQSSDQIEYLGGWNRPAEPYTILYRLPASHGESARILHVLNWDRLVSDVILREEIPRTFRYRLKVPDGHRIKRVLMVSPDIFGGTLLGNNTKVDPDRDGNSTASEQQNYFTDITASDLWSHDGDFIKVKVPKVYASTTVYVEFESTLTHNTLTLN
jgi:hypothetical protein